MKILFAALTVLFFSGLLSAQVPGWVSSQGQDIRYPSEWYIVGTGRASGKNGLEQAKEKAKADVASQLKVTVTSKLSTSLTEKSVGDNTFTSSDVNARTTSLVDKIELTGLSFAETYYSEKDNTYYVMAVLDRRQFLDGLRNELSELSSQAEEKLKTAESMRSALDIGGCIGKYSELLTFLQEMTPKVRFFNSLSSEPFILKKNITAEAIELGLNDIVNNITLQIRSGNNQSGRIGKPLPKPLVIEALYTQAGSSKPVHHLTVAFKNGGRDADKVITNSQGLAEYKCTASGEALDGDDNAAVKAYVFVRDVSPKLKGRLENNTAVSFYYSAESVNASVSVEIQGAGSNTAQTRLVKRMAEALQKGGATVNQTSSDYIARMVITSDEGPSVDGMAGQLSVQNVQMELVFLNKKSGAVVGTFTVNSKGVDKTPNTAIDKAVGALKIPADKLSAIIAKTSD